MSNLIVVGLITFKRPRMLLEALSSVRELKVPEGFRMHLMVCDNDKEGGAYGAFQSIEGNFPFDVTYHLEEKRGIVFARNNILGAAQEINAKYLAFFDDDETVDPDWLQQLVATMQTYQAQVVSGRVIYLLANEAPGWLRSRNFYGGDRPPTGSILRGASTNNVLMDVDFLRQKRLRFNEIFNLSGGSDSLLFKEVRKHGGNIVSGREAIAYEKVPPSRASAEWIINRAYKNGYTEVKRNFILHGSLIAYTHVLFYSIWLGFNYFIQQLAYPFFDYSFQVKNRRRPKKIKGLWLAATGKSYEEYQKIHGG